MLVPLPKLMTFGFETVDLDEVFAPRSPIIRIGIPPEQHAADVDAAFVRGAVGMAQLQAERERQAKIRARVLRRRILSRTKWFGAGALIAWVLTMIIVGGAP